MELFGKLIEIVLMSIGSAVILLGIVLSIFGRYQKKKGYPKLLVVWHDGDSTPKVMVDMKDGTVISMRDYVEKKRNPTKLRYSNMSKTYAGVYDKFKETIK